MAGFLKEVMAGDPLMVICLNTGIVFAIAIAVAIAMTVEKENQSDFFRKRRR